MKSKYKVATFLIMGIISVVVVASYLFSYGRIENIYSNQTYEIIFDLKKTFLEDTINNLIYEIDTIREIKRNDYERNIDRIQEELTRHTHLSREEFVNFLINRFEGDSDIGLWTVFLWDESNDNIIYNPNNFKGVKVDLIVERIKHDTIAHSYINKGNINLIFGVDKDYIDERVKLEVIEKIRNLKFHNDSYIWINQVIDYYGGKDYAIRLVHPNLPETEGMYLSTDMEDINGNLPYLDELIGVTINGETFLTYYFKELNSDQVSEKITYAKLYKDYDWIIAMGTHLDDIYDTVDKSNKESRDLTTKFILKLTFYITFALILSFFLLTLLQKRNFKISTRILESEANQDHLTKTFSRRYGIRELTDAFVQYSINGESPAIMIFDIDKFKTINDKYGHDFGDKVLVEIVQTVESIIRRTDKLIRWGGDEFVGIFHGIKEENLAEMGEKILNHISNIELSNGKDIIRPTISIGFSYFKEIDESYISALKRADEALYKSKSEGRNKSNIII